MARGYLPDLALVTLNGRVIAVCGFRTNFTLEVLAENHASWEESLIELHEERSDFAVVVGEGH